MDYTLEIVDHPEALWFVILGCINKTDLTSHPWTRWGDFVFLNLLYLHVFGHRVEKPGENPNTWGDKQTTHRHTSERFKQGASSQWLLMGFYSNCSVNFFLFISWFKIFFFFFSTDGIKAWSYRWKKVSFSLTCRQLMNHTCATWAPVWINMTHRPL